ncbi:endo-1,4-B-xylanase A [Gautieria morchelliformis]|nr:endo-1,4-B-xylanase A [Gautieria morchelliformis]
MNYHLGKVLAVVVVSATFVLSQSPVWGQCAYIAATGSTLCVSGSVCVASNSYYSQCIPSSGIVSVTSTSTPTSSFTCGATGTSTASAPVGSRTGPGLNNAAKAAGKHYFGSATDNPEFTDAAYLKILNDSNEFGQITPGNSMKWDATEPSQGYFTFTQGDAVLIQAKANCQIVRGHNLVWYSQLPSWVSGGSWTSETLTTVIQNHISGVAGHYKGDVYAWDVVNEPFNDNGTFRSDVFYDTIGEAYIAIALHAARAADPNAKLYINDYNIEGPGSKSTAMINLVKSLQAAGVPIDGIGVQGHMIVGELPSGIESNLAAFAALGVEVAITELDISESILVISGPTTLPATDALLAQQQKDYQTVVSACIAVPNCIGVTLWDYTDKYSWIPSTFSGQGAACPWDENLLIKPAYDGILNSF